MRLRALPGELKLSYTATVDLRHHHTEPMQLAEVPPEVMGYIYPSRYCQSNRLVKFAINEFGGLERGHSRQAVASLLLDRVR